MEGYRKFLGAEVLKAKILEAKCQSKLKFLGGGGAKQKLSVGGVWIFSGTTHCIAYGGSNS